MNNPFNKALSAVLMLIAAILAIAGIIGIFTGSFPYDSWDQALEAEIAPDAVTELEAVADGEMEASDFTEVQPKTYGSWEAAAEDAGGYYTWGPGGNFGSVWLAILAIVLSVAVMVLITRREDATLNEAAERLSGNLS